MPIYEYECKGCGHRFERIEKVRKISWKSKNQKAVWCNKCENHLAFPIVSSFKIGTNVLETTGKSGYLTDDLTLGKLVDEGGIPYEERGRLRKRGEMIDRQNKYVKELNARAKKYGFDPSEDE